MKKLLFQLSLLIIICTSCNRSVFLFSYFKGNGEDGLHLAYSTDGYHYFALNKDQSFITPRVSEDKLMRDPCITQDASGRFHMVWTVSWNAPGIGYAWSDDLIHWSEQQYIPVMAHEPTVRNSWAPEIFFEENENLFYIFWSSTIPGKYLETENSAESNYNHRMYYTSTKDFNNFSPTQLFFDQGFNVIDGTLLKANEKYYLIVKDETKFPNPQKNIRITYSDHILGPYQPVSSPISESWVEGPTAIKVKDKYLIYYDQYTRHKMGAISSTNLREWENISNEVTFPEGTRHGTVFKTKRKILKGLLEINK